jgi:hypothetical protein
MEIPSILKYTFLLHMIVAFIFGAWYFIAPDTWVTLVGWPYYDPIADRFMAALMIGFGVTSLFGFRAQSYEKVEIIVLGEIVFTLLATIGYVWGMTDPLVPMIGWALAGLIGLFFVLFLISYYQATQNK